MGSRLTWRRDDVDLYEFHLTIPQGVTTLHAHLDCIVTARADAEDGGAGVGEAAAVSGGHAGAGDSDSAVGEGAGGLGRRDGADTGGLPGAVCRCRPRQHTTKFAATNVEQLEDSPVITGQYFHEFALAPTITPKHYIDVVSDEPRRLRTCGRRCWPK